MLHILYGADDYRRHQALKQLKEGLGAGEMLSANTTLMAGGQASPAQVRAACDTIPFLAPRRLVVLEGLLGRFEEPRRGSQAMEAELDPWRGGLAEHIPQMPATSVLALVDGPLSRGNPLLRLLSPLGQVQTFPPLRGRDLMEWAQARFAQRGLAVAPQALRLLTEMVGSNLWALEAEVEKLSLYAAGRVVSEEDVRVLVGLAAEASIFALVDAVLEGRLPEALRYLHRLLLEGAKGPYILSMLDRQLRLALLAGALGPRATPEEAAPRLGVPPFAARRALEQGRRHPQESLRAAFPRLLEADLALKTGRYPEELALELLVVDLAHRPRARA